MTKCGFCGFEFDVEKAGHACRSCPMSSSCGLVRCPNCGYEFPPSSKLGSLIGKWWRKRENAEIKR